MFTSQSYHSGMYPQEHQKIEGATKTFCSVPKLLQKVEHIKLKKVLTKYPLLLLLWTLFCAQLPPQLLKHTILAYKIPHEHQNRWHHN